MTEKSRRRKKERSQSTCGDEVRDLLLRRELRMKEGIARVSEG